MKGKRLLSALVIGALVGAMTLGAANKANAQTDIYIDGVGSGSNHWVYGHSISNKLWTSDTSQFGETHQYTDWVVSPLDDTVTLSGSGSLVTNSASNGALYANNGYLTVAGNSLYIANNSHISSAVTLAVGSNGILRLTGGNLTLDNGDSISGAINASAGNFTIAGTRTLGSANYSVGGTTKTIIDGAITSNISLAGTGGIKVNSGKSLTIGAGNVDTAVDNSGSVILTTGTLENAISGTGSTEISGIVTNSSTINQSTGGVKISSGSLTTAAGNVTGTITNNVVDGYVLTGGTNNNTIIKSGTTGRTKIDAEANTVINQAGIQQDLYVATGTFNNSTGGSVSGNTLIKSGSTVTNTAGALNTVINDGTLDISGGTVTSVTNNATGTQGVYQSNGVVTNVSNTGGVYRQSGGTAANVANSGTYNLTGGGITNFTQTTGDLNISNGATLTVANSTNPLTSAVNVITNGNVTLGESANNTAGTLIIQNGLDTNQAKVLTSGTGDNTFIIRGEGTEFTTLTGTNIANGYVTVGNGSEASKLNLSNNGIIAKEVNLTVAKGSTMSVGSTAQATINTGDIWDGAITQTSTSTLTFLNNVVKDADNATYKVTSGTVNIGDGTNAGTLTLNNANDSIAKAANVIINSDSKLALSNGSVVLDNNTTGGTQDTWNGAITLSGDGILKLSGRNDSTDGTQTFNQDGGTLRIFDDGSLTLNTDSTGASPVSSSITGGKVRLGEKNNNTTGTLVINNGLANNTAQVKTVGTGASAFSVTGEGTEFTTAKGTDFKTGSVTVGDGTNASVLNLSKNAIIADAVALTVDTASKLNINGANAQATINSGDVWNGAIEQSAGTLTHLDAVVKDAANATYVVTGGTVNIGDGTTAGTLTLNNANDSIAQAAAVTIYSDSELAQSAGSVLLDGTNDTWDGAIELSGTGDLTLSGRTDVTDGTKTFNQTAGTLTIADDGSLTLNTDSSGTSPVSSSITGGNVVLGESTNNTAGTLIVQNGLITNQATITTSGTNTSNAFSVIGDSTVFTALKGTDIQVGSVTVGDGTTMSALNLLKNSKIADAVTVTIEKESALGVDGKKAQLTINSGDTWNGTIVQNKGTVTHLDNVVKDANNGMYMVLGGNVNIGDGVTSGTLTLNNILDFINEEANVVIHDDSKLAMTNGSVFLEDTDTWDGAIELSGDNSLLILSGRDDVTDEVQTFNQDGGTLRIIDDGSLTLNTVDTGTAVVSSAITGGKVRLGEAANDTAGSLVVNNGLSNFAQVKTKGTGANEFILTGSSEFTTTKGTDFEFGSVTVGDGTDMSTLNLAKNSIIADTITLTVDKGSMIDVYGKNAQLTINSGDTWNGAIEQSDGTVTHLDNVVKDADNAAYIAYGGNVNIGDGVTSGTLTLNNSADTIKKAADVVIYDDSKLAMTDGTVFLEDTDDWYGAIELSGDNSKLTLSDRIDITDDVQTFNQDGGTLRIIDNGVLVLNTEDTGTAVVSSAITGGKVRLGEAKNNTPGMLIVNNGLSNTAQVKTIGTGDSAFAVIGENTEFTTTKGTDFEVGSVTVGNGTDTSVLNLAKNSIIADTVELTVAKASELNISNRASAVIDDATDLFEGDVNMTGGSLEMRDLTVTTGTTSTVAGGSIPYYSQTGGALTLTNTNLSMVDSSYISGGDLSVDTDSTFNSLSNSFSVENLANAGLINGINGGYENYAVSTGLYAGDSLGDVQGDFTTDLYARSNSNKNYDSYGSGGASIFASDPSQYGILNVSDWTLNGDIFGYDAPIDKNISMNNLFKGSVATGHTIDFTSTDKEVFTPIGWYGLHSNGGGNYSFGLNRYNPGTFRGQVTTLAQYQNQLAIDDMIFNHTMLDQGFKGNDYIASNPNRLASANDLYPPYEYSRKDGGLWVKMYGNFERLHAGGMDVGNNAYGTIIGADFGLKELKHGWQFMPTVYIGYNGAHQYMKGYGAYQNGGQLGLMGTWYKNDFMIGAMAYGGIYGNQMSTPRGDDDAFNYFAGGAVKGAYNWKFAKNWALQPNLFVSYNYFGQQNWHSDFGQMGMMSGALNGINIAPGLNLIYERETWSAYVTLQYMYNINQATGGRAGNVDLPRLSMDRGYLQYGIGVNKKFTDRFSAYFQTVIRNVGRNGIGLQAGFQWKLGKGGSNTGKGNVTPELKKTEIKLSGNKIQ